MIAIFIISGYFLAFIVQSAFYVLMRHPYKIGDALGYLIRGTTDTIASIFKY